MLQSDWASFRTARAKAVYEIRAAKIGHFKKINNENRSNPKIYWDHLKHLPGTIQSNLTPLTVKAENGGLITDPVGVANQFNNTFVNMSSQYEHSIRVDDNSKLDNLSTDMTSLKSFFWC